MSIDVDTLSPNRNGNRNRNRNRRDDADADALSATHCVDDPLTVRVLPKTQIVAVRDNEEEAHLVLIPISMPMPSLLTEPPTAAPPSNGVPTKHCHRHHGALWTAKRTEIAPSESTNDE